MTFKDFLSSDLDLVSAGNLQENINPRSKGRNDFLESIPEDLQDLPAKEDVIDIEMVLAPIDIVHQPISSLAKTETQLTEIVMDRDQDIDTDPQKSVDIVWENVTSFRKRIPLHHNNSIFRLTLDSSATVNQVLQGIERHIDRKGDRFRVEVVFKNEKKELHEIDGISEVFDKIDCFQVW